MKVQITPCKLTWVPKLKTTTDCEGRLVRKVSRFGVTTIGCKKHWQVIEMDSPDKWKEIDL